MNWWIGSCWFFGTVCFAVLDYRAGKMSGKRWRSDWPWRLAMYFALGGGLFATVGYAPIFLFQFGEAIIGLYNHPPAPKLLVALVPLAIAPVLAMQILKAAGRTIRGGRHQPIAAWRMAVALLLFAVAVGVIGAGLFAEFYFLSNR